MSVARVTELTASSTSSFDDAIRQGIDRANESLRNVRGAWVSGQKIECNQDGSIKNFMVHMKVTFVVEDE